MSLPNKIKAIVLTCDRYRAITEHMIFQYDRLWPGHPFVFHVPYQELDGVDTEQVKYLTAPSDIKGTVLHLLTDIDDEEWIYWCVDDKYPIQLVTDKIGTLISHAMRSPEVDAAVYCNDPLPVPLAPDVTVIHEALVVALQAQPLPAVTATLPVPPDGPTLALPGAIENAQPLSWLTVKA